MPMGPMGPRMPWQWCVFFFSSLEVADWRKNIQAMHWCRWISQHLATGWLLGECLHFTTPGATKNFHICHLSPQVLDSGGWIHRGSGANATGRKSFWKKKTWAMSSKCWPKSTSQASGEYALRFYMRCCSSIILRICRETETNSPQYVRYDLENQYQGTVSKFWATLWTWSSEARWIFMDICYFWGRTICLSRGKGAWGHNKSNFHIESWNFKLRIHVASLAGSTRMYSHGTFWQSSVIELQSGQQAERNHGTREY